MEGMLSELDYLEPECYQLSILEEFDRDYSPIQSITPGSPIEFFIKGADGLYVDLNNSKLEVRAKITLENGNKIPNNANVGPINNLLNALFMTAEMELGGVLLTDTNTKYPYRAYVENLINFNKLIQETRMMCEGWTKDTAGHLTVYDITSTNAGLATRAAWFASGNVRTLIGRPHFDLFHQDRLIPPNIDMKFRFLPSKNSFLVKSIAPAGTDPQIIYKVEILSARFFMKTKVVAPSLALAQEKILQTKNFKIPYKRVTAKTLTIPTGTTSFESDNVYLGKIPDMIMLGLVSDANMSGGYQNNPFYFQHFGLNYLSLKANGEQFPRLAYQPDFANNEWLNYSNIPHFSSIFRLYKSLFHCLRSIRI